MDAEPPITMDAWEPSTFYGDMEPGPNRFESWWAEIKMYIHVKVEREEFISIVFSVEVEDEGLDAASRETGAGVVAFYRETYLQQNLPAHLAAALARAARPQENPEEPDAANCNAAALLEEARAASSVLLATLEAELYDLICSFMYPDVEEDMCEGLTAEHPTCATTLIRRLRAEFIAPHLPREAGNREAGTAALVDKIVALGRSTPGSTDAMIKLGSDLQRDGPAMGGVMLSMDTLAAMMHTLRDSENPSLARLGRELLAEDTTPSLEAVGVALSRAKAVQVAKCLAVAMGHHERLGAASPLLGLDAGIVRIIADASRY